MMKFAKIFIVFLLSFFLCGVSHAYNSLTAGISPAYMLKSFKDVNYNLRTINKMKKQAKKLSVDDKNTITKYFYGAVKGENTFLLINCCMRDNFSGYFNSKDITLPLKSRMEYYADCLTQSISKTKLPQNMLLYGGIDEKEMKHLFGNKKINSIITAQVNEMNGAELKKKLYNTEFVEKGFLLTSYDIEKAKKTKFLFEIKAPKNLQAVLLDGLKASGQTSSKEILINKGYKWKVTDVTIDSFKDGKTFYKIELKLVL